MGWFAEVTMQGLSLLSTMFVWAVGLCVLALGVLFVVDYSQTEDAIRRNYPVIGRFRHLFSTLGEFFRQYFFAMDREEMPFNRAERDWVERSSEGVDNTVAFGSTKNLGVPGTVIFANSPFPPLDEDVLAAPEIVFGPDCETPYRSSSLINVSAMSYGSISKPAIQALSRGAKSAGCWLNTGEGGLSPYHLEGGCDVVFQIGTANYGVRDDNGDLSAEKLADIAKHSQVRMFEIKLSQGAKPGKGGILPASKVTPEIAIIRGIPVGEASISPNRHPAAGDVEELLDLIALVREATGKPTGIKTVVGSFDWIQDFGAAINARGVQSAPDFITIDGGDGGTGAAPMPLIDNVGLTIREALPGVVDALIDQGLRDRIRLIASGKLITPAEVAWAYCAGADTVNTARGFMFALGCIQSLKCNKNTCPTGITTHDPRLQRGLDPSDKAERVANFANKITYGVSLISHSCGVSHPRDLDRSHCRIVQANGRTCGLNEIFPPHDRT